MTKTKKVVKIVQPPPPKSEGMTKPVDVPVEKPLDIPWAKEPETVEIPKRIHPSQRPIE